MVATDSSVVKSWMNADEYDLTEQEVLSQIVDVGMAELD